MDGLLLPRGEGSINPGGRPMDDRGVSRGPSPGNLASVLAHKRKHRPRQAA